MEQPHINMPAVICTVYTIEEVGIQILIGLPDTASYHNHNHMLSKKLPSLRNSTGYCGETHFLSLFPIIPIVNHTLACSNIARKGGFLNKIIKINKLDL